MRHLLLFFAIGGLLFGAKRLLPDARGEGAPVLTVHVPADASAEQLERAIDEAVLVEQALDAGAALLDPLVREQLLSSMRLHAGVEAESDQVLLERALALGLHRADPVTRQRLAFHAEQLLLAAASAESPTEDELAHYLAQHPARYTSPARVSFSQLFLSRALRGERLARDAAALKLQLTATPETPAYGDASLLPIRFEQASPTEIDARFGPGFAALLAGAEPGSWSGPFASSYGLHLVRVEARAEAQLPALSAIRARVLADYRHDQRRALLRQRLQGLRARYRLDVQRLRS